jgi:hypothetical protein
MNGVIQGLKQTFSSFTDARKHSNNKRFEVSDAALSAFSVFFTQCPSLLEASRLVEQGDAGMSNMQAVFGVLPKRPATTKFAICSTPSHLSSFSPSWLSSGRRCTRRAG